MNNAANRQQQRRGRGNAAGRPGQHAGGKRPGARQNQIASRLKREAKERANFTKPLTGKRAGRIARAMSGIEYKPAERQLASEIRGSEKRVGDLGQWYGGVAQEWNDATAASTAATKTAEDATNARLAATGATGQANLDKATALDAETAARLGGPTDAAGAVQRVQAQQALQQQGVALAAPLTMENAAQTKYLAKRVASTGERGIEARREERSRQRKIRSDLLAARKEHGQTTVSNLNKLREFASEQGIKQQAFGSKEHYNRALEKQSKLGLKSSTVTARATEAAANAAAHARERGASAQEVVAAEQRAAANVKANAQTTTAKIYSKGGNKDSGGIGVREAEGFLAEGFASQIRQGKSVSRKEAINYLVNRGVKAGVAKKVVGKQEQAAGK